MRVRISLAALLIFFCLIQGNQAYAQNPPVPAFVDYQSAEADITWVYWTPDGEQVVEGVFSVTLPDKYSLTIVSGDNAGQKITGYRQVIAVYLPSGQVEYNYESIQLFKVYETLFCTLLQDVDQPINFITYETLGGRNVARYETESQHIYWLDRETSIPMRITDEQGTNILSLRQYQVDADYKKGVEAFTLAVNDQGWQGVIRLAKELDHWFPSELQVGDDNSQIIIDFSNWRLLTKPLELKDLQQLDYLLSSGQAALGDNHHDQIIQVYRQLLNIDPFYAPAYTRLAFSYASLGDFLGAVENYQQWLALEPHNTTALNNLAYTYMQAQTNLQQAIGLAYQAVSLDPRPAYLDTLGYGYYLVGDYDKALYYLLQAEKEAGRTELADIWKHLAQIYLALEDQDREQYYQYKISELLDSE